MISALVLRKHNTIYPVAMGLFVAWLYSFPMYGPLLAETASKMKVDPTTCFLVFTVFHALGLIGYGYFSDSVNNRDISGHMHISLLSISFITVVFPFMPASAAVYLIGAVGLLSAPAMVIYQTFFAGHIDPGMRGKILGSALIIAQVINIPFTLPGRTGLPLWAELTASGFLPVLSLIVFTRADNMESVGTGRKSTEAPGFYWPAFVIIILGFYTVGGLMYSIVYTKWFTTGEYTSTIAMIFYALLAITSGFIADRFGRRYLMVLALSLTGLGFVSMIPFADNSGNFAGFSLLQAGFAAMDLFVFLTVSDWAFSMRKPVFFIGLATSLNVFSIFISTLVFARILPGIQARISGQIFGAACVLILVPLVIFIRETLVRENGGDDKTIEETAETTDINNRQSLKDLAGKFRLTPREIDVAALLLEGRSSIEIQEILNIKNNTLKTHLRNIYSKTEVGSQREFVLMALKK